MSEVGFWAAHLAAFAWSGKNENILRVSSIAANLGIITKVIIVIYGIYLQI